VQLRQLRILSTVLLAFAVAQAGLGSGYLDGFDRLLIAHATNAFAVFVLTVLTAISGFAYRRHGGPGWTFYFPLILIGVAGMQVTLGFAGVRGGHVFLGVLFLCAVAVLCSYVWRLRPAETPVPTPDAETLG
jgi:heme/copper-type cytochrome/quinol oxidase subunit 1